MSTARFALVALLLAACGRKAATPSAAAHSPADSAAAPAAEGPGQAEATALGRELFELVDRTMGYYSAHLGEFPRNITDIGVDSLTGTTVRRLSIRGKVPTVSVTFRRPEGHELRSCAGTNKVLEDSMLNNGAFTVACILADGSSRSYTVGGGN